MKWTQQKKLWNYSNFILRWNDVEIINYLLWSIKVKIRTKILIDNSNNNDNSINDNI